MIVVQLKLAQIRADESTQARAQMYQVTVEDYLEALRAHCVFPPVLVFRDADGVYWLADGFHRFRAHELAEHKAILADVRHGTKRDAVLCACGANVLHGLRRSNEDKRRAVMLLLEDEEWHTWPQRQIAEACGVSEHLVRLIKGELAGATKSQTESDGSGSGPEAAGGGRERIERTCQHLRQAWEVGRGLVDVADELEHQIDRAVQIAQSSTEA